MRWLLALGYWRYSRQQAGLLTAAVQLPPEPSQRGDTPSCLPAAFVFYKESHRAWGTAVLLKLTWKYKVVPLGQCEWWTMDTQLKILDAAPRPNTATDTRPNDTRAWPPHPTALWLSVDRTRTKTSMPSTLLSSDGALRMPTPRVLMAEGKK